MTSVPFLRRQSPSARQPVAASIAVLAASLLLVSGCVLRTSTAPPADAVPASSSASDVATGATVAVPTEVVMMGSATLVVVPVSIGGEGPFPFILDTGASTSAISSGLVERLGLEATGESSQVNGVVGSAQVPLVQIPEWSVGSASLRAADLGSFDFPVPEGSSAGSQLAGLLGSDQLSRFGSVTIDYEGAELRFTTAR